MPDDLRWVDWGGDFTLYHRPSGKTHFLNDVSHALLTDILKSPCSTEEIVLSLAGSDLTAADDGLATDIADMLSRFEQLGLVRRVGGDGD